MIKDPAYVREISSAGVPGVWIATSREMACCDHHFSEGLSEITTNSRMYLPRDLDEMRADCPYAQLERFRRLNP